MHMDVDMNVKKLNYVHMDADMKVMKLNHVHMDVDMKVKKLNHVHIYAGMHTNNADNYSKKLCFLSKKTKNKSQISKI